MKHSQTYSHRFGLEAVKKASFYTEITNLLDAQHLKVKQGAAPLINKHLQNVLSQSGWALKPEIHSTSNVSINAIRSRIGLTTQTGNTARAFYDLLKFQFLHLNNRIDVGVLILPSIDAGRKLGRNIANFGRVTSELELYTHIVTVPCLILSFD